MAKTKTSKRRQKFNYNTNRRREWKKRNKLPAIESGPIKNAWNKRQSIHNNMKEMGLSSDLSKTFRIATTRERLAPDPLSDNNDGDYEPVTAPKQYVAEELQAIADMPTKERDTLSQPMVDYCIYMLDKYGEDYKAMARDVKNYYQDTPKQIKKKIAWFKGCKVQYNEYLAKKLGKGDGEANGNATRN